MLAAINNFNTSSLHGIAAKLEKVFVNYLDELEDSDWLDSLLTTVENSVSIDPANLSVIQYENEKKKNAINLPGFGCSVINDLFSSFPASCQNEQQ